MSDGTSEPSDSGSGLFLTTTGLDNELGAAMPIGKIGVSWHNDRSAASSLHWPAFRTRGTMSPTQSAVQHTII